MTLRKPRGLFEWVTAPLIWMQAAIITIIMLGLAALVVVAVVFGIIMIALHYLSLVF